MAAKPPSPSIRAMLVEGDIALWDASHYTTINSKNPGRPTAADPVRVVLMSPSFPDRHFSGTGLNTDEAVLDALTRNPILHVQGVGVRSSLARLDMAMGDTVQAMREWAYLTRWGMTIDEALDDDVPF